jgi:hypothetical protein
MLRAIGDQGVVQRFGLEDEFGILYQGRIKQWAQAIGMPEDVLRGYHAAHWSIPGPADLQTFYQRFGPGRPTANALGQMTNVTDEDINRALREQGIAPFWRPFYVAAMFQPMSRFDLRFGYNAGVLDDDSLKDGLQNLGFSSDTAKAQVGIFRQRKIDHLMTDPIVKAYEKNGVNLSVVVERLENFGADPLMIDQIVQLVETLAGATENEEILKLLEKDYATGGISLPDIQAQLATLGYDQTQIERISLVLQRRKQATPRQIPARELCSLYSARLIGRSEFLARLVSLRYSENDAELIVAKCESDLSAKQLKQEQLLLKQQAASERRRLSELSKEQRQAQLQKQKDAAALLRQQKAAAAAEKALERQQAQAATAATRKVAKAAALAATDERTELRILGLIERISDEYAKKFGGEPVALTTDLKAAVLSATRSGDVTVEEILRAAAAAVSAGMSGSQSTIASLVSDMLLQLQSAQALSPEPSTNGQLPPSEPAGGSPTPPPGPNLP